MSAFVSSSWGISAQRQRCKSATVRMSAEQKQAFSRRDFLSLAAAVAIVPAMPQEARANVNLMQMKRSYFRYVPRIEEGTNYYVLELYPAISKGDWDQIASGFTKTSVARPGSEKAVNDIDPKTTYMERQFFTPMKTWSNSFAEKGTSPKSRAMLEKEEAFEGAMTKLETAIKSRNLDAASAAWVQGKDAYNAFITVANKGLSRELRKLQIIPDDLATYVQADQRPTTTF